MLDVLDAVRSLEYRRVDVERINRTRTPRLFQGDVYHPYRSLLARTALFSHKSVTRRFGGSRATWLFKALLTNLIDHVMGYDNTDRINTADTIQEKFMLTAISAVVKRSLSRPSVTLYTQMSQGDTNRQPVTIRPSSRLLEGRALVQDVWSIFKYIPAPLSSHPI